jgi:hypothetical protein
MKLDKIMIIAVGVCGLGSVLGCGSERTVREPARVAPPTQQPIASSAQAASAASAEPDPGCVARSPDTRVGAQFTARGAALVFTTTDDVATLRRRASSVAVPDSLRSAGPRIDNIHQGVRLVFDAEPAPELTAVREQVVEHARQVAKRCGLVLTAPSDQTQPRPRATAEQKRTPPPPSAPPKPKLQPPKEAKADKDSKKPPKPKSRAAEKPKPADTPAPPEKPREADRPREDRKPKEDKKPSLPRLPGPHPDPIVPSARHVGRQAGV